MMHFSELAPVQSGPADQLRLAAAAYLARYTGTSRDHTESDLRCYLTWCAARGLDPLYLREMPLESAVDTGFPQHAYTPELAEVA